MKKLFQQKSMITIRLFVQIYRNSNPIHLIIIELKYHRKIILRHQICWAPFYNELALRAIEFFVASMNLKIDMLIIVSF